MHMCDLYLGYRFGIWGFTSTFDLLSKFGKQNQSAQKWASSITRTTRARVIFWDEVFWNYLIYNDLTSSNPIYTTSQNAF